MSGFKVVLESVDTPGRFTFVTVEEAKDLEDLVNQIHSEFSHQFTIEQIEEIDT